MRTVLSLAFIALLSPAVLHAGDLGTVKVTLTTITCKGTKGLASVDADSIVKIESIKCDEGDPVAEVYQILVTGEPGSGLKYRVFTTSQEEAARLMAEVEAYQKEKRESLTETDRIIIEKR